MPKKLTARNKTVQMVVVVPAALHEILIKKAEQLGRPLVDINRTILSQWAEQHCGYTPVPVVDGRTKQARSSRQS